MVRVFLRVLDFNAKIICSLLRSFHVAFAFLTQRQENILTLDSEMESFLSHMHVQAPRHARAHIDLYKQQRVCLSL